MRTNLLVLALTLLALFISWDYVKTRRELDKSVRELHGVRLEIAHGKYDRVFEKRIILAGREKIVYRDRYVPPEGSITLSPKDKSKTIDEVVEVKVKWYGLTFRPGFTTTIAPIGLILDSKLAYMNRFGLIGGLGLYPYLTPSVGMSYRLDAVKWLSNTEAACMYLPLSLGILPMNCGVRINF